MKVDIAYKNGMSFIYHTAEDVMIKNGIITVYARDTDGKFYFDKHNKTPGVVVTITEVEE